MVDKTLMQSEHILLKMSNVIPPPTKYLLNLPNKININEKFTHTDVTPLLTNPREDAGNA